MDSVIELRNVSKKFHLYSAPIDRLKESLHPFRKRFHHEHWALRELNFSVKRGETLGVMGRNGAGKSTLLQLITSVLEPSAGEVCVRGRISALLELGAGFNPEMTGRENVLAQAILLGVSRQEMASKLPEIEAFADIGEYIDQPVRSYSSGMFVRLAFAMFISTDPDILIIDEALAVGDATFQEKCFRKLREFKDQGKTFILVSHSAQLISQLCDRVLIIEKGKIFFEGDTRNGLIKYGQLMFGSQVPSSSEASLRQAVLQKTALPEQKISESLLEWKKLGFDGKENFHSRPGYNKNEKRSGNKAAKIVDYLILANGDISPTPRLVFYNEISIYIKVFYEVDTPKPRLAISISTPTGILLYGANTSMMQLSVPQGEKGKTEIYSYSFKNKLAKGSYILSLWLMSDEPMGTHRLDTRESSLILESEGSETFNGIFDMNVEIHRLAAPV